MVEVPYWGGAARGPDSASGSEQVTKQMPQVLVPSSKVPSTSYILNS